MAIKWTGPMIKRCALIYTEKGMSAAILETGLTKKSIECKMASIGATVKDRLKNHKPMKRKFFAEDVAYIMELVESKVSTKIIAEMFDSSVNSINKTLSNAKNKGFDAYPMRS